MWACNTGRFRGWAEGVAEKAYFPEPLEVPRPGRTPSSVNVVTNTGAFDHFGRLLLAAVSGARKPIHQA